MKLKKIEEAFSDERGSIADIFYNTNINHIGIIKNNSGKFIRGNHYHKLTTQSIYMTKGKLRYWYKPVGENKKVEHVIVQEGYLVTSEPNEVHSLEILGDSEFIVFSEGPRGGEDYEKDTYRDKPILEKEMLLGN